MGDGFGADKIVVHITTPQVLRPLHAQAQCLGRAYQGLGWQQVKIGGGMQVGAVAGAVVEPEDLRQPTGQGAVGFHFVQRCIGPDRVRHHGFFAVGRGHASPLGKACRCVVQGLQGSGQGAVGAKGWRIKWLGGKQ